jgi:hypothetical protein
LRWEGESWKSSEPFSRKNIFTTENLKKYH